MSMLRFGFYGVAFLSLLFIYDAEGQVAPDDQRLKDEIFQKSNNNEVGHKPDFFTENTTDEEEEENESKLDVVLGRLVELQNKVDELQTNIEVMCAPENFVGKKPMVFRVIEKTQCEQRADLGVRYEVSNCGSGTTREKSYYVVNGTASRRKSPFCIVYHPVKMQEKDYSMNVQMYNFISLFGSYYGFPGLAFNIQDDRNFDFVIIRLHEKRGCFQTGFLQDGRIYLLGSKSGPCHGDHPRGRAWFNVEIQISKGEATLFVNKLQAANFKPHFPSIGRGGVIVKLGEHNVIFFKHLTVTPFYRSLFDVSNCHSHLRISENYYRLDSDNGRWPEAGFCQAIWNGEIKNTSDYAVSADLFNQRGADGDYASGILGIMYNVQDKHNFDFVYFKAEQEAGCYFTGFVENSRVQWANSKIGSCSGGPFKGGAWNKITIYARAKDVMIHLNGRHVVTLESHFENRAIGGVIVSNSNEGNVISVKNFHIKPITPAFFSYHGCHSQTRISSGYFILNAKGGKWPQSTFCRAFSKNVLDGENYEISTELFVADDSKELVKKFYGLAFNIRDSSNYDFLVIRPKSLPCFYGGYVMNNVIHLKSSLEGECQGGPPKKGSWFKLSVSVRKSIAIVSLGSRHLLSLKPNFPPRGRGGVLLSNIKANTVTFRYFKISVMKPLEFELNRCGPRTNFMNSTFMLDASQKYWPVNLFCTALYHESLQGVSTAYTVEAFLQNVNSYAGIYLGQPGLIFNAIDANTFEYVYIRLHNKKYCYQFGSIIRGRLMEQRSFSGSCAAVRPEQGSWFRLTVKVSSERKVQLYIDEVLIAKYLSVFPMKPRGGVLVPNGFKNVIMVRDFKLYK